jgi:nicotinamide riboside kinase
MLISFTGAQSTGKTTLLKQFKRECGSKLDSICFVPEVTRKVKREYNVNINESGDDDTQLLIVSEHLKNVVMHMNSSSTPWGHLQSSPRKSPSRTATVLDRCIIDALVYSNYLHSQGTITGTTLTIVQCMFEYLLPRLDVVFYTSPKDIPLEDDGERSVDISFREYIIKEFERIITEIKESRDSRNPKIITLEGTVDERMEIILNTL